MSTITETKISFYQFKKETHHKHVKYSWTANKNNTSKLKTKELETQKFYCTLYKNQLSMPQFGLSKNQEWFKIDSKTFKAISEYGSTIFEVLEDSHE